MKEATKTIMTRLVARGKIGLYNWEEIIIDDSNAAQCRKLVTTDKPITGLLNKGKKPFTGVILKQIK